MNKKILSLTTTLLLVLLFASCGMRRCPTTFDEGVVINGIRWATRNVDAPGTFAESPESPGMFFQWNRRQGWNTTDENVEGWDNSIPTGTKWYAKNDPCPRGWRVPNIEELNELRDTHEWVTRNGVSGRVFGTYPYQIFLPAVSSRHSNCGTLAVTYYLWGNYWYRDALSEYWTTPQRDELAHSFYFSSRRVISGTDNRANGFNIRCVAK